jgi:hypothetical protein
MVDDYQYQEGARGGLRWPALQKATPQLIRDNDDVRVHELRSSMATSSSSTCCRVQREHAGGVAPMHPRKAAELTRPVPSRSQGRGTRIASS